MKPVNVLAAVAALALAAGCASNPPDNAALEQARAAVGAAQADPHVPSLAPAELDLAQRTLEDTERLAREDTPAEYVSHRAYIAEQRARIARETAMARAAEAEAAQARAQRSAQLRERAREAEAARERAEALARESQQRLDAMEQARRAEQTKELAATEQFGADMRRLQSQVPELQARETADGWVVGVDSAILFDSGQAALRPGGRRAIDNVARILRQHPGRNVLVEGFAQEAGGDVLNRHLSERRAQAVRNALVLAGVDGERILARGMGPAAAGDRRVQIVIAPEPASAAAGATR
jgi:outer membrane protein OmpA-like peptidoglycan-associated protein